MRENEEPGKNVKASRAFLSRWYYDQEAAICLSGGDPRLTHAQELAKYGQVIQSFATVATLSVGEKGGATEFGTVVTEKGWEQDYYRVFDDVKSLVAFAGTINYFNVSSKDGYQTTFSGWASPVSEKRENWVIVGGSFGTTKTYTTWGFGFGPGVISHLTVRRQLIISL